MKKTPSQLATYVRKRKLESDFLIVETLEITPNVVVRGSVKFDYNFDKSD